MHRHVESVAQNNLETAPHNAELGFAGLVGVAHGAGCNHCRPSFPAERVVKQLGRVALDLDIFEIVGKTVTFRAAVAVYASVRAAAVDIHSVFRG